LKTEHSGLKQDGTPDKRVGTGEFAQGKIDPHEAGKQGGNTSGSRSASDGSSSGNTGGSGKGGMYRCDSRIRTVLISHVEFAHGKVDPVEAGRKGGNS
jgi:general stress protein YciG